MRNLVFIVLALGFVACSESTEQEASPVCATGEQLNPITGACFKPSTPTNNTANNTNNQTTSNNEIPVADVGNAVDAGSDATDMADVGVPNDGGVVDPPDMSKPVENLIRFIAIGDQGTGSATQRKVGQSIGTICQSLGGCDFGLLLGDNVYDTGVSSIDDSIWITHFEEPYGHLPFPFYAVLGNHDLGGDGLGIDLDSNKATYQVQYSQKNPQWKMPSRYYDFSAGPAHFIALDSTKIFFGQDDNQRQDVPAMIARAGTRWKVAFGHHPYYSNGPHGNAGSYEGVPFVPIVNGEHVRSFIDDHICGKVDFYICGHDHSRQDLVDTCQGTQFLVSGAGAKTTDLEGNNPTHFQSDLEGFLLIEATDNRFTMRFYDENGALDHERTVTR